MDATEIRIIAIEVVEKKLFDYLESKGILPDWREPNVIRMSPIPLYNTFEDVYRIGVALKSFFENK